MSGKAYELYNSFEEWVSAHRHSAPAIKGELDISLEAEGYGPVDSLRSYIMSLETLGSEIAAEISEARDWIEYFGKKGR
jgi:hypothetical protein